MSLKLSWKRLLSYLVFVLPALIVYTVLTIYPLIETIYLSFTNWSGYSTKDLTFVGLQNYMGIFKDEAMKTAFLNTIMYTAIFPIIVTVLAIPLAIALNSKMKTKNFQRAAFFFPSVASAIIVGYLWSYILSPTDAGIINKFLELFGIEPVMWLSDPKLAMLSVILVGIWACTGWHACIYIAKLQSIPSEYFEAAEIDGASNWQRFRFITLPMLSPAMTVSLLLLVLNALKIFDLPFALTSGGPGYATTMISQVIIQKGFVEKSYGQASAMSVVFFIFVAIISIVQLKITTDRESE